MFDDTLLDSSPKREPVLKGIHWIISAAIGVVGFIATYFFFQEISGSGAKSLVLSGMIVGALIFCYALMLCYTYADSKHLRLNTWVWFIIVLLLPLAGYILYLIHTARKTDNWKRATIPISYILEAVILGVLILIPLLKTEALPLAQLTTMLVAPPPPPPPPPPPSAAPPKIVVQHVSMADLMKAPTVIPKKIVILKDQPRPTQTVGVVGGVPGGVPGGQMGGVLGGVIGGMLGSAPPPPPKVVNQAPIRVGGDVEEAKKIYAPPPTYPEIAKDARIQGTVVLQAVIAKDGTIKDLKVLSGSPLLVHSAVSAVSQWRYQPTLLNGQPVEVITEIAVNFTLNGD